MPNKPANMFKPDLEAAGADDVNVTKPVLAACLALLRARHGPTLTSGEKANATHGIVSGVIERGRRDSNPQPSDRQSDAQKSQVPKKARLLNPQNRN
ncbi:MAG: hypothetical protein ACYTE3_08820 [Planctomycetota bacterium]